MSKEFNPITQGLPAIQHSPELLPSTHIENTQPEDLYKTLSAPLDVQVEITTLDLFSTASRTSPCPFVRLTGFSIIKLTPASIIFFA